MVIPEYILVVWPSGVYECLGVHEYCLRYPDVEALADSYAVPLSRVEYIGIVCRKRRVAA